MKREKLIEDITQILLTCDTATLLALNSVMHKLSRHSHKTKRIAGGIFG